jgi:ubiquinone/menaquinone biosynthesis C-methylase UbiE
MKSDSAELKERYEGFAKSLDYATTASDFQLRELEIDTGCEYLGDGMTTLDVGCGLGYAVVEYARRYAIEAHGIDYAENMISGARELLNRDRPVIRGTVHFQTASVTDLPFEDARFDVVTSSRCLMALLDWDLQRKALTEIHRVLRLGGVLVLMEGTFQGLEKLNAMRARFGLAAIAPDGRDRLFTLKFDEEKLIQYTRAYFSLERTKRFGMYYFLTRVVQPLLVAPDQPRYDHKINEVAKTIARLIPDFEGIGHLVAFVFTKRR